MTVADAIAEIKESNAKVMDGLIQVGEGEWLAAEELFNVAVGHLSNIAYQCGYIARGN